MSNNQKIYTKTGDKGETSLIGGTRVPKFHIRIEAYGTVDELNSYLGLIRDQDIDQHTKEILLEIQDRLFTAESMLACECEPSANKLPEINIADISLLEKEIDSMNSALPELHSFILPGGNSISSYCQIARCICRRAERITAHLAHDFPVNPVILQYLNRLSDYLFVLARKISFDNNCPDTLWKARK
jgi:cob(I)alamin adenosyltransferase